MNTTQRALKYLIQVNIPVRKERIAKEIQASVSTLAQSLADLSRGYYIKQSKGFYTITPKGKAALEEDPLLTKFEVRRSNVNKKQILVTLPTLAIENSETCKFVIQNIRAFNSEPFDDEFLPFVLLWLTKNGYNLPEFKFEGNPTSTDEEVTAMRVYYQTLRGQNNGST